MNHLIAISLTLAFVLAPRLGEARHDYAIPYVTGEGDIAAAKKQGHTPISLPREINHQLHVGDLAATLCACPAKRASFCPDIRTT